MLLLEKEVPISVIRSFTETEFYQGEYNCVWVDERIQYEHQANLIVPQELLIGDEGFIGLGLCDSSFVKKQENSSEVLVCVSFFYQEFGIHYKKENGKIIISEVPLFIAPEMS